MSRKTAIVTSACLLLAALAVMSTTSQTSPAQQTPVVPPGSPIGRYQLSTHVYKEANGVQSVALLLLDTTNGQVWQKQESTIDRPSSDKWNKLIEPLSK